MVKTYTVPSMEYYPFYDELLTNNHILIGGKTGSGKSVLLNDFLYNILSKSPCKNQYFLIDPKRVELSWYRNIDHCIDYANDIKGTISVLNQAINIMEKRYKQMEKQHIRTYQGSTIYIIIDELADLMTISQKQIMPLLQRIAQLGRASGIFIVAATQSPSRITIPAALTLNFTCRIALQCFSAIESKQILGVNGAESLPRYGKCLIKSNDGLMEVNVPMTADEKLNKRIAFWESQRKVRIFR